MFNAHDIHTLEDGIELLRNDHTNGARVLATNALRTLCAVISSSDDSSSSARELWVQCRLAAYKLVLARPSMGAAITSAVVNGLNAMHQIWEQEHGADWLSVTESSQVDQMRKTADRALQNQIQNRDHNSKRLADGFVEYIRKSAALNRGSVRILTISFSSTLPRCLDSAVRALPDVSFSISVLESRPGMEGTTLATTLMKSLANDDDKYDVKITIAPESHVCALSKTTDILLFGADRVSSSGDVSNKMGSLSAAMAVKTLSKGKVVVITETDKIARPGPVDEHEDEDNDPKEVSASWPDDVRSYLKTVDEDKVTIRNTYFEWIPPYYVDSYITEAGVLNVIEIAKISEEKAKLEDELFDTGIVQRAREVLA